MGVFGGVQFAPDRQRLAEARLGRFEGAPTQTPPGMPRAVSFGAYWTLPVESSRYRSQDELSSLAQTKSGLK